MGAVPVQPLSTGEQEPLLEGQEAGNSVNATTEDVESGGHSPDAKVRGIQAGFGGGMRVSVAPADVPCPLPPCSTWTSQKSSCIRRSTPSSTAWAVSPTPRPTCGSGRSAWHTPVSPLGAPLSHSEPGRPSLPPPALVPPVPRAL